MKILLATGRRAEGVVKNAVRSLDCCEVLTQDLGIAAFSTPKSLRNALEKNFISPKNYDLVLVSGLCKSDFSGLEKELATPVRLGPRHAYDLGEALQLAGAGKGVEAGEREREGVGEGEGKGVGEGVGKGVGKRVGEGVGKGVRVASYFSPLTPADLFLAEKRRESAKKQLAELERSARAEFSVKGVKIGGGARMKVCAEIVDATLLSEEKVQRRARYFVECGADILDVGVHLGAKPGAVRRAVRAALGAAPEVPLSVDSLDADLILAGVEAGAEIVLSLNRENIARVGNEVAARGVAAVVVPDFDAPPKKSNESLFENLRLAEEHGIKRVIADPVLNAVGYGIAESLHNYFLYRERDKTTPLFFGVGNVTELLDADSVGVNAVLAGVASELNADILFTPEHSDKARGSVRELRVASEMMTLSKARCGGGGGSAPKDVGLDLLVLKEKRSHPPKQLQDKDERGVVLASGDEQWRLDPKGCFRIGVCEVEGKRKIYAKHAPSGRKVVGGTAKEVAETILRLGLVSLLEHAAYLSAELTKAELALRLDRSYEQDEVLF